MISDILSFISVKDSAPPRKVPAFPISPTSVIMDDLPSARYFNAGSKLSFASLLARQ